MSYIINSTNPFVSVKLTDTGRRLLSLGQLTFGYWGIGDSELNYEREEIVDANPTNVTLSASSKILRPFDKQPNLKYYITPTSSTSVFQPLVSSNSSINVIKAIVNNEATERGFFTHTGTTFETDLSATLTNYQQRVPNSGLTGSSIVVMTSTTSFSTGDYMLLKLTNNTIGTILSANTTTAIPNLWYKVQGVSGNTIEVDRKLPNYSASTAFSQTIFYRGGEVYNTIATGNTTAYWDSGTLSFNSSVNVTCHDVPVWNMNNVWCENMAGMTANTAYENYTKFGSYQYLGTKYPYLEYTCESSASTSNINCNGVGIGYPDEVSKSTSIIHYTNNTISSLYGEFLYVDATSSKYVKLHLPNLMYHRRNYATASGTTMGMTFIASGTTQYIGDSDIEYIELVEDPTLISTANTQTVVGKVFPQLKMIVIDDDEIVAAISYKTNRNWTLPSLSASLMAPSGGTSTGILATNETMYLTYVLGNTGTGLTTSLPCQSYIKVTNSTASAKDVSFKIESTDLLPYMRKLEYNGDGMGFAAKTFKLLYQIVAETYDRPDPSLWKSFDYTSNAITINANETIDPRLLENQNPTTNGFVIDLIKDASSTLFNLYPLLNMAETKDPTFLQFGDERFFYGNLETYIGATIYKTIFDININASLFNTTTNPTRSTDPTTNPPSIKVSEIGIFDNTQNLVCIGKLSKPIALVGGNTILLELSLDF